MNPLPKELLNDLQDLVELDGDRFDGFDEIDDIEDGRVIVGSHSSEIAYGGFFPSRLRELARRGLLQYDDDGFRLTDTGRTVARNNAHALAAPPVDPDALDVAGVLERFDLHPSIAVRVRRAFQHHDPQQAVKEAFDAIEIHVRATAASMGVALGEGSTRSVMAAAFKVGGPLADPHRQAGEQDGIMHLFQGAIGAVRNQNAHARPIYAPEEALRLVFFADHLLHLVDATPRTPA